ncbi:hypothetical protein C8R32_102325 [Nitrosospira sp. Nsp5]|uniref:Uncharacterized protein n=1 Tax=Nitrosospira multiformis TaxID=1231 RepID=A0ABY0TJP5_9PROT|nr:hypothetical protein C8R32_102325 [Nitrosospira sp. Nsp5]SCY37692.1 hypothetical protein SAMN05216308_10966 [Nitrosospira sp. Nsp13]SDQ94576.1 hypothetical protein SAMN05216402_2933 [Nitrosospira multiformis]
MKTDKTLVTLIVLVLGLISLFGILNRWFIVM